MVKGLWESVRGEWGGDVDLADGKLQIMFAKYKDKLKWIGSLGLDERSSVSVIKQDLHELDHLLVADLDYVHGG